MPWHSTTDKISILQQMQVKHLIRKKKIYFAFVDLKKAYDWVPPSILCWAMNSRVRVNGCFGERFEVTNVVNQGSVLSQLLLTIAITAPSCECRIGCPWELLHTDDFVIMSDNLEDLRIQLQAWRTSLDTLCLRINVGKTKIFGLLVRHIPLNKQENNILLPVHYLQN